MPKNQEQDSMMSDQGHIFGQLMKEQADSSKDYSSDNASNDLDSCSENLEATHSRDTE